MHSLTWGEGSSWRYSASIQRWSLDSQGQPFLSSSALRVQTFPAASPPAAGELNPWRHGCRVRGSDWRKQKEIDQEAQWFPVDRNFVGDNIRGEYSSCHTCVISLLLCFFLLWSCTVKPLLPSRSGAYCCSSWQHRDTCWTATASDASTQRR